MSNRDVSEDHVLLVHTTSNTGGDPHSLCCPGVGVCQGFTAAHLGLLPGQQKLLGAPAPAHKSSPEQGPRPAAYTTLCLLF